MNIIKQNEVAYLINCLENQKYGFTIELAITEQQRQAAIQVGALRDYMQNFVMSEEDKVGLTAYLAQKKFPGIATGGMNSPPSASRRHALTEIILNDLLSEAGVSIPSELCNATNLIDFKGKRFLIRNAGEVMPGWHFCPSWPKRDRDMTLNINALSHAHLCQSPNFFFFFLVYYLVSDKKPVRAQIFLVGNDEVVQCKVIPGKQRNSRDGDGYYAVPIRFPKVRTPPVPI